MIYTPPEGDNVIIDLKKTYTAPQGDDIILILGNKYYGEPYPFPCSILENE